MKLGDSRTSGYSYKRYEKKHVGGKSVKVGSPEGIRRQLTLTSETKQVFLPRC